MALSSLNILKKGLEKLENAVKDRKANTVDEKHIINMLEDASDYERGVAKLDDKVKAVVMKLKEWAGGIAHKVADALRKRKCMRPLFKFESITHQPI